MKQTFSNFTIQTTVKRQGIPGSLIVAQVDVTSETGFWFWKKSVTERVQVFREDSSPFWRLVSTGEHTPGREVECLELLAEVSKSLEGVKS